MRPREFRVGEILDLAEKHGWQNIESRDSSMVSGKDQCLAHDDDGWNLSLSPEAG